MGVTGATPEAREAARAKRTLKRRAEFFRTQITGATSANAQFGYALDYAQAVKHGLDDDGKREFARAITALADDWSKKQ